MQGVHRSSKQCVLPSKIGVSAGAPALFVGLQPQTLLLTFSSKSAALLQSLLFFLGTYNYVNFALTYILNQNTIASMRGDDVMKIVGERLRSLRESVKLSQTKLAKEFDTSQSAIARYELNQAISTPEILLKYADYFDVSMDYIFGRTDNSKGAQYENHVNIGMNNPEMARFVEMCFDPGSAMNERLKATVVQMLSEEKAKK